MTKQEYDRQSWALSNLRPLHKTENMKKSDKVLAL